MVRRTNNQVERITLCRLYLARRRQNERVGDRPAGEGALAGCRGGGAFQPADLARGVQRPAGMDALDRRQKLPPYLVPAIIRDRVKEWIALMATNGRVSILVVPLNLFLHPPGFPTKKLGG